MNKIMKMGLIAGISALLCSCAPTTTTKSTVEINPIDHHNKTAFYAMGPAQINVLGPVFYIQDSKRCSKLDLLMAASKKYPKMFDVINIEMEETDVLKDEVHHYSCKYYGLAVSYSALTAETIEKVRALRDISGKKAAPVSKKKETPATISAPVVNPATDYTNISTEATESGENP